MAGMASGAEPGCQTEKWLGLLFFTENLDEPLELIPFRAAVDATIHQEAKLGR